MSVLHDLEYGPPCSGDVQSYVRRYHSPESSSYERCIGLLWCPECRCYSGAMVHVPRSEALADPLAGLGAEERERLLRSEVKLVQQLGRMYRRAPAPVVPGTEARRDVPGSDHAGQ